jgi:hypothetical protein
MRSLSGKREASEQSKSYYRPAQSPKKTNLGKTVTPQKQINLDLYSKTSFTNYNMKASQRNKLQTKIYYNKTTDPNKSRLNKGPQTNHLKNRSVSEDTIISKSSKSSRDKAGLSSTKIVSPLNKLKSSSHLQTAKELRMRNSTKLIIASSLKASKGGLLRAPKQLQATNQPHVWNPRSPAESSKSRKRPTD